MTIDLEDTYLNAITNLSNELKKIGNFNSELPDIKSNYQDAIFIQMNKEVINGNFRLFLPEKNELDIKSVLEYNADIYLGMKDVEKEENYYLLNEIAENQFEEYITDRERETDYELPSDLQIEVIVDEIKNRFERNKGISLLEKDISNMIGNDLTDAKKILHVFDKNEQNINSLQDLKEIALSAVNTVNNNINQSDYSPETSSKEQAHAIADDLVKYAESKRLTVPEKTQKLWYELLTNGESEVAIKNYIDQYSNEIKGPIKEKGKDIGMDI